MSLPGGRPACYAPYAAAGTLITPAGPASVK